MIINITTVYALRVLLYMAWLHPQRVTAREIVSHLNLPDKYVRRLITRLSKNGFIKSLQGRNGGYIFTIPPGQISVKKLAEALNDTTLLHHCILNFENCNDAHPCALHEPWARIRLQIQELFSNSSLQKLIEKQEIKI